MLPNVLMLMGFAASGTVAAIQEPICFFAVLCSGVANVNRTDSGIAMTAELEGERLVP